MTYKLKIIVEGNDDISDKNVVQQFTSGKYTHVDEVIDDVISFLKATDNNSKDLFGIDDTILPDLDLSDIGGVSLDDVPVDEPTLKPSSTDVIPDDKPLDILSSKPTDDSIIDDFDDSASIIVDDEPEIIETSAFSPFPATIIDDDKPVTEEKNHSTQSSPEIIDKTADTFDFDFEDDEDDDYDF